MTDIGPQPCECAYLNDTATDWMQPGFMGFQKGGEFFAEPCPTCKPELRRAFEKGQLNQRFFRQRAKHQEAATDKVASAAKRLGVDE